MHVGTILLAGLRGGAAARGVRCRAFIDGKRFPMNGMSRRSPRPSGVAGIAVPVSDAEMPNFYRKVLRSQHPLVKRGKDLYRRWEEVTLPAPRVLVLPLLWCYVSVRSAYYLAVRWFICEPIFKAYCKQRGRGVRTGPYIHWIAGSGDLIVGDEVLVDGKCSIHFSARLSPHPTLRIGNRTGIGHGCRFAIGKSITIGEDCRISESVWIFDSSGHPADPEARHAGEAPRDADVRPVVVGNNVWIGGRAIIHPGVTIGDGSVVSAGAVVMSDVPPFTIVAGNPARKILSLQPIGEPNSSTGA